MIQEIHNIMTSTNRFGLVIRLRSLGLLDEVRKVTAFLDGTYTKIPWSQRFWHIENRSHQLTMCEECGNKPANFVRVHAYYAPCSRICVNKKISKISQATHSRASTNTRSKQTCMERYGVDNPMKDNGIFIKNSNVAYKFKPYKLPSGNTIMVQGFENLALDTLLLTLPENDILIDKSDIEQATGRISYAGDRTYYPDLYIKSQNKIIEVKSLFYYKKDLLENLAKRDACLALGMGFEFWIYDKQKNRIYL